MILKNKLEQRMKEVVTRGLCGDKGFLSEEDRPIMCECGNEVIPHDILLGHDVIYLYTYCCECGEWQQKEYMLEKTITVAK